MTEEKNSGSIVTDAAKIIRDSLALQKQPISGRQHEFVILPEAYHLERVPRSDAPIAPRARIVRFARAADFAYYVKRWYTPQTTDEDPAKGCTELFCVLNLTGSPDDCGYILAILDGMGERSHREHVAVLEMAFSVEFKKWVGIAGKTVGQRDMAKFLRLRYRDIVPHFDEELDEREVTGLDVLRSIRNVSLSRATTYAATIDESNDEVVFHHSNASSADDRRNFHWPRNWYVGLQVFEGGQSVNGLRIRCSTTYEMDDKDGLQLGFTMDNIERGLALAFETEVDIIERSIEEAFTGYPAPRTLRLTKLPSLPTRMDDQEGVL